MRILVVHQNLPGQYKHLVPYLLAGGHAVTGLSQKPAPFAHARYRHAQYEAPEVASRQPHAATYVRDCATGAAAARACEALRAEGYAPDVILAHTGWGEALFLKEVWPDAPILGYFEYWYTASGGAVGYDPEYPASDAMPAIMRARNATNLVSMDACDHGQTATAWQRDGYPAAARSKITALHEGVRTDLCRPDAGVSVRLGRAGRVTREDEVFTFMARNMEPTRGFHVFMRALPEILAARPKARCLLIGGNDVSYGRSAPSGSWRAEMEREIGDEIDWDRVHFLGRVPYEVFVACMQLTRCHAYLTVPFVPSWSLLEAMACGAPVVASDVAPVQEVTGGQAALVPFAAPGALAAAVIRTLGLDEEARAEQGAAARAHVVNAYDAATRCLPAWASLAARVAAGDA